LECAAGQEEGDRKDDRAGPERYRKDLAGEIEEAADGEDEDRARQQGGVGAVAGEVLADRDLETTEAGQGDTDAQRGRVLADDADDQRDDAAEDDQLGEREVPPRSRGSIVRSGDAACRLRGLNLLLLSRCSPRSPSLALLAQRPQAARLTGIPTRP
jgi:hypothetical protein